MNIKKDDKFNNKKISIADLVKFEDNYSEKELFCKLKFIVKILKKLVQSLFIQHYFYI